MKNPVQMTLRGIRHSDALERYVGDEAGNPWAMVSDCQWVTIVSPRDAGGYLLDNQGQRIVLQPPQGEQPGQRALVEARMSFAGLPCIAVQCR
ncbi:MAG: hypothetical protein ABIH03_15130, partial [Pseudomonadota bacterium]